MAITLGTAKPFMEQAKFGQEQVVTQLQSQIQQVGQGPDGGQQQKIQPAQAQQLAAQVTQAQAAPALQAQEAAAKQAQTQEQQAKQAQKLQRTKQIIEQRQKNATLQRENEDKLFNMNAQLKAQVLDDTQKFRKDELGRTVFNERQLIDWAMTKAKNEEDFEKYEQIAAQTLERKRMIFDQAWRVLEQDLQQAYQRAEQEKDQDLKLKLSEMKRRYNEARRRMEAEASANSSMWTTIGSVGGAILGGTAGFLGSGGNPLVAAAGAQVGSTVGGGAGKIIAGKTTKTS